MTNIFSVTSKNNGMLVGPSFYMDDITNPNEIGKNVLDSMTKDMGMQVTDMVNMMTTAKMGIKVESQKASITNANVQRGGMSQLSQTLNVFSNNTVKPLNNPNALTSYSIANTNPSAVSVSIGADGISSDVDMNLEVEQLAQAQTLSIDGFTSPTQMIDEGVITIDFGSYQTSSFVKNTEAQALVLDVTAGMTLNDVANEINAQSGDITATVVKNLSGGYTLALMSSRAGLDNAMQVRTSGGALEQFAFNGANTSRVTESQTAKDSKYTLNGVPMSSSTNNVSHMGLDLTLMVATSNPIKISTKPNTDAVVSNLRAFVENYNATIDMYNSYTERTPSEDYVGSLYNTDVAKDINETLGSMWDDINSAGLYISELGMALKENGTITLDESILRRSLTDDPNIAKKIMASTSEVSNNDAYSVISNGDSIDGVHKLLVDTAPEKARYTTTPISASTNLAVDTEIDMNINGKDVTVTLPAGDYSPSQLASKFSFQIHAKGISDYTVFVSDTDEIVFESNKFGTSQCMEIKTVVPELGLLAKKASGADVKGYINGERFIGTGTTIQSTWNDATSGLEIKVDPDKLILHENVTVTTKTGILDKVNNSISELVNPVGGLITKELNEVDAKLSDSGSQSLLLELKELEKKEQMWYEYYSKQYSALTATLAELNNTQDFLTAIFNEESD